MEGTIMPDVDNLTLESVTEILSDPLEDDLKALPPEAQAALRSLLPKIADRANRQAEANKTRELQRLSDDLRDEFKKAAEAELAKIREANKPPTPEALQALLSQQYLEFRIEVRDGKDSKREFVIRELPQKVEKKLYDKIRKSIVPHLKE